MQKTVHIETDEILFKEQRNIEKGVKQHNKRRTEQRNVEKTSKATQINRAMMCGRKIKQTLFKEQRNVEERVKQRRRKERNSVTQKRLQKIKTFLQREYVMTAKITEQLLK